MGKILIPASCPDDWKEFLAEPEKHWRRGYSARALACCWQAAGDIPSEVRAVLQGEPDLRGLEAIFCIPEYQVKLPGGSRPSQSDNWVLGRTRRGLVSIAVEGKASESFGPTIGEWFAEASPGKETRLRFLCAEVGIQFPPPEHLRYQLLHRTASAIIEAKKFGAPDAIMVVHSFSPIDKGFEDYREFLQVFGLSAAVNGIAAESHTNDIKLHFAWVHGSCDWLSA